MSSALRGYGVISQTTKFQRITTPAYDDRNLGSGIPIPFSYSNGILDINIQDNVQVDLIDDGDSPGQDTRHQCKTIGTPRLVTGLGPKMIEWLENCLDNNDSGEITDIKVFRAGQVIKVQFAEENALEGDFLGSDVDYSTYAITSNPPASDEFVYGTEADKYRTVYIFKTPITISYKNDGIARYLTLFSNYSGND